MTLPNLYVPTWTTTIHSLHDAAQVVGGVQRALLPKRHNSQHLPLQPIPMGIHTQTIPGGLSLSLDYGEGRLLFETPGLGSKSIALEGLNGDKLMNEVIKLMRQAGFDQEVPLEAPLTTPMQIDGTIAAGYAAVQYAVFTGLARFKARIEGRFSPIVVFPHHFDISTVIFAPGNVEMDEGGAHLNFGFAPFTDGQYEHPYLYAYAHPFPEDFAYSALPGAAYWHREGWTGAVLNYDAISAHNESEWLIERTALSFYETLIGAIADK
ncbi:MAG: DUF5996 family protein [Chloroflexota bacterium]|nr:DUF5996 family protein [Chloroflexota bacterium]